MIIVYGIQAQDMSFWADAMINSSNPEHRLLASDKFKESFDVSIKKENSFNNSFEELSWISVQYPADTSFRIISWQIEGSDSEYLYYGYFQNADQLIPFNTANGNDGLDEYDHINLSNWSGALVYRILQNDDSYMLWTFRFKDEYTKVKTCEPIIISSNSVRLGDPIFQEEEGSPNYMSRHILQYSADMNGTLDYYDETNRIVFDNLIMVAGRMEGQGMTYVADGSYRSFDFTDGKWKAKTKLFNQVSDRAPRVRGRSTGGKDLFGRKGG